MTIWRRREDGLELRVRVQPKARRPALGGLSPDGGALRVAVAEAPEDGRANRAVCAAIATALGVPPSAVEVAQGAASRLKTLRIAGEPDLLSQQLDRLLA